MTIVGKLRQQLQSGSAFSSMSVLASGSLLAQFIVMLASPLLTRLYTPQEFGFLAIFSSMLNMLMVVASLRYQIAIPLAKNDRAGVATVLLCLVIGVGMAAVVLFLLLMFGDTFARLVNVQEDSKWFYLLPVAVLFAGWFEAFRLWGVRTRSFIPLAKARVQQSAAMTLVQIGGFRFGVAALVLGQVVGRIAGFFRLAVPFRRAMSDHGQSVTRSELVLQASDFRRFPIHSTWGTLLSVTGRQLPTVYFAALVGPAGAGLYALSQRMLSTPLTLVSESISSVFTSRVVASDDNEWLGHIIRIFSSSLCMLAAVPTLALMVAGEDSFAIIFGSAWSEAGVFSAIMAPWVYLVFVSTPVLIIFSKKSRDAELSIIQLVQAILRVVALFCGWLLSSAIWALVFFSVVSSAMCVYMLVRVHQLADMSVWQAIRPVVVSFGFAILVVSPLLLNRFLELEQPLIAWVLFALFAAVYYLWFAKRLLRDSAGVSRA